MKLSENYISKYAYSQYGNDCIAGVAMGVFAYTELTGRLTSLETSRELYSKLIYLKNQNKSPQTKNSFMLLKSVFEDVEKLIKNQEQNMTNKVNIEFLKQQLEKTLADVEVIKR